MADDDDDDENDDDEDDGVQGPLATKGTNAAAKQARTREAHTCILHRTGKAYENDTPPHKTLYTLHNTQHTTHNTQDTIHNTQHTTEYIAYNTYMVMLLTMLCARASHKEKYKHSAVGITIFDPWCPNDVLHIGNARRAQQRGSARKHDGKAREPERAAHAARSQHTRLQCFQGRQKRRSQQWWVDSGRFAPLTRYQRMRVVTTTLHGLEHLRQSLRARVLKHPRLLQEFSL